MIGTCLRCWRLLLLLAVFGLASAAVTLSSPARWTWADSVRPRAGAPPAPAQEHSGQSDAACLACHSDPALEMTFPNGDVLGLYLDFDEFRHSVHGSRLACADCHQRNLVVPHEAPAVQSRRQLSQVEYEACKRCHFDNYARTLDSMHFDALAEGKEDAPLCTDCHGAHNVTRLTQSRVGVAKTCAKCHDDIYDEYKNSVHGWALTEEDNKDVPVCITCHGVHNIAEARTASFRQASVGLCAGCHADEKLMNEYNISPDVFKTYLDDFHGKTVGFYQKETTAVWPDVAVCTDCHGVHSIQKVDEPGMASIKQNLVETCRKCHENATPNFSSAWLSHYEPSPDKALLVYLVKQYYRFLIPAMVAGLALNIALDLWRLARNR